MKAAGCVCLRETFQGSHKAASQSHLLLRLLDKALHTIQVGQVDEGSHPCIFQKRVSNFDFLGAFHHLLCEVIQDLPLHEHPGAIAAHLGYRTGSSE